VGYTVIRKRILSHPELDSGSQKAGRSVAQVS